MNPRVGGLGRTRRVLLIAGAAAIVAVVAIGVIRWRTATRAGSDLRVTLELGITGPGTAWIDPATGAVWCLTSGQAPPPPTGSWSDGIAHGGAESSGTLHFVDDDRATFTPDLPASDVELVRGGTFSC